MSEDTKWYHKIKEGDETVGPMSLDDLIAKLKSGEIAGSTPVWNADFGEDWKKASEVPELKSFVPPPEFKQKEEPKPEAASNQQPQQNGPVAFQGFDPDFVAIDGIKHINIFFWFIVMMFVTFFIFPIAGPLIMGFFACIYAVVLTFVLIRLVYNFSKMLANSGEANKWNPYVLVTLQFIVPTVLMVGFLVQKHQGVVAQIIVAVLMGLSQIYPAYLFTFKGPKDYMEMRRRKGVTNAYPYKKVIFIIYFLTVAFIWVPYVFPFNFLMLLMCYKEMTYILFDLKKWEISAVPSYRYLNN